VFVWGERDGEGIRSHQASQLYLCNRDGGSVCGVNMCFRSSSKEEFLVMCTAQSGNYRRESGSDYVRSALALCVYVKVSELYLHGRDLPNCTSTNTSRSGNHRKESSSDYVRSALALSVYDQAPELYFRGRDLRARLRQHFRGQGTVLKKKQGGEIREKVQADNRGEKSVRGYKRTSKRERPKREGASGQGHIAVVVIVDAGQWQQRIRQTHRQVDTTSAERYLS
jgi:hypothetical protein